MRYFNEYRTFDGKLPHAGGLWDQSAMWHRLIGIVLDAERKAERERKEQEALEQE